LTYPLGLGTWLGFTDAKIGRAGEFIGLENFSFLVTDSVTQLALFNTIFYTVVASIAKFGARPVARAAAEQEPAVPELLSRGGAAAVDRAHGALGDRVLVDLRCAVFRSSAGCCSSSA